MLLLVVVRSFTLFQQRGSHTLLYDARIEYKNRTLVFVHVGKTGGETIKWRLRVICDHRASKRKKARCLRMFHGIESALSRSTIGYVHCDKIRPKKSIQLATTFLFSIRDPLDRVFSWYQYMHPRNCLLNQPSAACNLKKDSNPWGLQFYRDCFPTVNDLVNSISHGSHPRKRRLDLTSKNDTTEKCTQLAIETLQGRGPKGPTNHLHFNYLHLANQTISQFPNKEIMVVRKEFLWDDLKSVEGFLGGNTLYDFEREGPVVTHGSEKFPYQAVLNQSLVHIGAPSLCCVLYEEIQSYSQILTRAVNLDDDQKQQSLRHIFSRCGASSLADLIENCANITSQFPRNTFQTIIDATTEVDFFSISAPDQQY
ncbi:sulfotransferase family protein [Nitzschia inconspicua]|uniref:Sulfotransferase family protein n=1 Tax=Nitzschia inconspicua TaxID=303405 RepID=A0A9K3M2N3_9STRA|nr:sulfotransferase family protein [Nitzschia inconspicua]